MIPIIILAFVAVCLSAYIGHWVGLPSPRNDMKILSVLLIDFSFIFTFCTLSDTLEQRQQLECIQEKSGGSAIFFCPSNLDLVLLDLVSLLGVCLTAGFISWLITFVRLKIARSKKQAF